MMSFIAFCIIAMAAQSFLMWLHADFACDRMHQNCDCPIGRVWKRYERSNNS